MASWREVRCRLCGLQMFVQLEARSIQCSRCGAVIKLRPPSVAAGYADYPPNYRPQAAPPKRPDCPLNSRQQAAPPKRPDCPLNSRQQGASPKRPDCPLNSRPQAAPSKRPDCPLNSRPLVVQPLRHNGPPPNFRPQVVRPNGPPNYRPRWSDFSSNAFYDDSGYGNRSPNIWLQVAQPRPAYNSFSDVYNDSDYDNHSPTNHRQASQPRSGYNKNTPFYNSSDDDSRPPNILSQEAQWLPDYNNNPDVYNNSDYSNHSLTYRPQAAQARYDDPPPNFQPQAAKQQRQLAAPPSAFGRKRAVLCGVNYRGKSYSLKGSINDVKAMKSFLVQHFGFPNDSILMLTEDEPNPKNIPTKENMRLAMRWLVQGCQQGDSLVFHFSGHGSRQKDYDGDELDGQDEALCPLDHETEGKIIDDEINSTIVWPLASGVKLHAVIDACYSGTVLDLAYVCRMKREGCYYWEDQTTKVVYKGTSGGVAFCFSACDDDHTSGDTPALTGSNAGAMTNSFIKAAKSEPDLTYGQMLKLMRMEIREAKSKSGFNGEFANSNIAEEPQLSSSEKFDVYSRNFFL